MFKLLTTVAASGSMLGHRHHRHHEPKDQRDRPHHMHEHECDHHHRGEGPQPPRRHVPPPEDIMEDRRHKKHHQKGHGNDEDEDQVDQKPRECPVKKMFQKAWHTFVFPDAPIVADTYLGDWFDKKDAFEYGAWYTYINLLGLEEAQECLHAQLMVGIDYDYAIMQMWKGESQKVKWEGVYRFVNTAIADAQI